MTVSTLLVFGRRGQLAQELAQLAGPGLKVACVGREHCDLAGGGDPRPWIDDTAPDLVINAAAYTAVDLAETEREAAHALNAEAPARIAQACAGRDLPLIHVSTDYVFDGEKHAPYVESDRRSPLGVYGVTKAAGEDAVLDVGGRGAVVRLGWLYSRFGANFPLTMLRLATTRDEIGVVADQTGRPTHAAFAARTLLTLGERLSGEGSASARVLHLAPRGEATWADFAEAVMVRSQATGGPSARIARISTADYPTTARRPPDSRLDATALETLLDAPFPDWRDGVADFVRTLAPRGDPPAPPP